VRRRALAAPGHAVGPGVVLDEPPERRLVVTDEDTLALPLGEQLRGLLLVVGQGQANDVVRTAGEVGLALLGRDHVVGRATSDWSGPCDALVVAERAKRLDVGHGAGP
jgi:hypothetical protein